MKAKFRRNLFVGFGASVTLLLISSTASYISIKKLLESYDWVNHTQEVLMNLNEASTILINAQNSVRGFVISGEEKYLDDYSYAENRVSRYFDDLQRLTSDNPKQQQALRTLLPIRAEYFKYLRERVEERRSSVYNKTNIGSGKRLMDTIDAILSAMEEEERGNLLLRTQAVGRNANYSLWLMVFAAVLAVTVSVVFFLRVMTDYAERLKLSLKLEDKDREMARRIEAVSNIAGQISKGNYKIRTDDRSSDALGGVAGALNEMATELDLAFTTIKKSEWFQTGRARLAETTLGDKAIEQLTQDMVAFLAGYMGAQAAALYIGNDDEYRFVAGYNYLPEEANRTVRPGQGLSGEALREHHMLELNDIRESDITITYAMGEIRPTHVVALPLFDTHWVGVLELAKTGPFTADEKEFLSSVSDAVAIAIRAAQSRTRVQELLEETQAQTEELQAQHTELESMNAELEAQTEKLQASEEELRVQQEELQQANEELSERSVLLEERNTEILQKSDELERSTRYKSEFLANMSHELRTPLNSILLLSRLLSENTSANMNEEQVEFARVILSSGNGLLGLIDEILDLSKIEAGKMDLEFLEATVEEISVSLRNLFAPIANEKGIGLEIDIAKAPMVIRTDRMRLEQILKNLLSNALKFTSEGSVTLKIFTDPDHPKRVLFQVIDTGIGIPKEKQPLVFEAFKQADGSTKRKYGGTGLGLSISRELARLLKGDITLTSEPGKGSTFTLSVPVYAEAGFETVSLPEPLPSPSAPAVAEPSVFSEPQFLSERIPDDIPDDRDSISLKDKTILIVEDDVNFANVLLDFTRKRGYKGVVSVRGDKALDLALLYRPAGILLDIQLPVMSGWEVMEVLKANATTRSIPVHIMSSHKMRRESLLKGAVNFLEKPAAFEQIPEVFERIEQIVNRESQKVLILEDNPKHAKALAYFLENHQISSEIKRDVDEGIVALNSEEVDCVILDMGVPDNKAYELLEGIKSSSGLENLPVIVFTGKSLSMQEEMKIRKYADSIVVKTAHSYRRMLDEVTLFLHLVEENADGKKAKGKRKAAIKNVLEGKTVLLVDDDVRNIYSLTKALESHNMEILTAIDGREALDILKKNKKIDVVLLDMMMPNLDGYETASQIRNVLKMKELPVIAVTAKAMTGDREKCINAGASDYITKPVDTDQLLSLLRVWLYD